MDSFLIAVLITVTLAFIIGMVVYLKKKARPNGSINAEVFTLNDSVSLIKQGVHSDLITIPIKQLPATTQLEENKLFEIKDSTVIDRISQTIPAVAQTIANTAAKRIAKETLNNPQMFLVKIPSGTTLVNPTKKGVQYATYRGAKKGLAEVVKPDFSKLTKASSVANGVANVMNLGSLVVGQYYMTEINSKLEEMSKSINKISDFQNRELKSKIFALVARVGEISVFSSEIIDNDDFRNRKLQTLDDLKGECTQLLQQVNLTIDDETKKNPRMKYDEYQAKVDDFTILYEYQQVLLSILEKISKLTYLLGKGESTNEMCYSIFSKYLKQTEQIRTNLGIWHDNQAELLAIDIDKNRKSKTGVEGFIAAIPGIVDDKWKYKELKDGLRQKISAQKATKQLTIKEHEDIYEKDVQIVIKDGKYFYLLGESNGYN